MAETDIRKTIISNMEANVPDFSVDAEQTDAAQDQKETTWINVNWSQYLGYYKKIPEYKTAINAFATWVIGKGWNTDLGVTAILESITGWGEDTFMSILWNMLVIKKVNGDAYAEIIRNPDTGTLLNLKPLDPGTIKIVVNRKGKIKRYEQIAKTGKEKGKVVNDWKPQEILHFCNDRVADEIHGTSITESVEWVILARNEAMDDWKKVLHRNVNPLKIVELDTDNQVKIDAFITKWENTVKDKETIFIPKGNVDVVIPPVVLQDPIPWIKYLENFFYQALGIPKVILGGSQEFTEASSKISYLTYEQIYTRETEELMADLWNQLAIRITFVKPASIKNELLQSEDKNTVQTGFQPNDTEAGVGE